MIINDHKLEQLFTRVYKHCRTESDDGPARIGVFCLK